MVDFVNNLTDINQIISLISIENHKPIVIFKDSLTCGICVVVKNRFLNDWDNNQIRPFILNVKENRSISNEIADLFGVTHESPQILVIKNKKCIYNASHYEINYNQIKDLLK